MFIRPLAWGMLCAASCLFGTACASKAQAQEAPLSETQEQKSGAFCGGFAALQCPEGYACVDDPKDSCDPATSGADCGGICVKEKGKDKPTQCDYDDPTRRYVSQDPEQCAAIRFFCEEGFQPFFNDCGCGCEPVP
jgi:hypothetical protein